MPPTLPSRYSREPFVESILCATDFSAAGLNAFAHALMMALTLRCEFTLFHAGAGEEADQEWSRIPGVREVLERWGYLEKGSSRREVFEKVAVKVSKVYVQTNDALGELADLLEKEPVDLVVIGTNGDGGAPSWLHHPATHRLARDNRTMTLFVPCSGGFVSLAHGGFTLRRVLVPVADQPDPHPALTYAFRAAVFSTENTIEMDMLHVGDEDVEAPRLDLPDRDYLRWQLLTRTGNVPDQILRTAAELHSDLIAMTTDGASGLLGALRGSITQRVIREAACPVLAVPVS
ncbi:MAG TPA: universal stress protein [Bryobacteraceae bacterium]|nr:universal stress protein [Bryobacteraceae bacterium]